MSPPALRHTPAIEALLSTVAELIDDTPTGTCMFPRCLRVVDRRSPSTWFCSQQHSADWLALANGDETVLQSRITMAEKLAESHASSPACRCGCVELCAALETADYEDRGIKSDPVWLLARRRAEIEQYARELADLRARLRGERPDVLRHPNGIPMSGASFELNGLAELVENRVMQIFHLLRSERGPDTQPGTDSGPARESHAVDALRYAFSALQRPAGDEACDTASMQCRCHPEGMVHHDRATAELLHWPVGTLDLAAVVPPAGNHRARRRWRRFWQAAAAQMKIMRPGSSGRDPSS